MVGMARWESVAEEVIRDHGPALVGYASLFTSNLADAEDLVHDALVRTFAKPRGITDAISARVYVKRAIRTVFLDSLRSRTTFTARRHLLHGEEAVPGPEQAVVLHDEVSTALGTLAPRQRACVALRYYDDLPLADIATELGISVGAVKRYLSDATTILRTRLAVRAGEPGEAPTALPTLGGESA